MASLNKLGTLAPVLSAVVHDLQKERGMSAGFINSKGRKFSAALTEQRSVTDKSRTGLRNSLANLDISSFDTKLATQIKTANLSLEKLASIRTGVTGLKQTLKGMATYYTGTITKLLTIIEEMGNVSSNAEVTRAIAAYANLLQGKERAGLERAMGAAGFGAGKFSLDIYLKLVKLVGQQKILIAKFKQYASDEQSALYDKTLQGQAVDEVARMREIAFNSLQSGDTKGISGEYWFGELTQKIDLMKKVEDTIAEDLLRLTSRIKSSANTVLLWLAGFVIILAIGVTALASYIINGITKPIKSMTSVMRQLAKGNNEVEVQAQSQEDEIGQMARAVQVFKDNAIEKTRLEAEQAKALEAQKAVEEAEHQREIQERQREADENAAREASRKRLDELTSIFGDTIGTVLDTVSSQTSQMEASAQSMTDIAQRTDSESVIVASAAEEATTSVQTVAGAAEELNASITEISRQVALSSQISDRAVETADQTSKTVNELADDAQKIGEVVEMINDIADKTNLLALNATIEAARAGDAGKGFAVVASEVKSLAAQTSNATNAIENQISEIQATTQNAVTAINSISATIAEMNEIATSIASAVEEQGAATGEISRSVQEAAEGTREVAVSIVKVKTGSEETDGAANEVLIASRDLSKRFVTLRSEVEDFLLNVKTV